MGTDNKKKLKFEGYSQDGYSIIIFAAQKSKLALDGVFATKFFEKYNSLKETSDNVGWDLIESMAESLLERISTSTMKE